MNADQSGQVDDFGDTTEAVTEGQDTSPAPQTEQTPDSAQAAAPVDASGDDNVVGRRNEDLPTDGGPAEEPHDPSQDSTDNS